MNYFEDIANLISIRTFLVTSIDNLHMKLSREDIKNIQTRIQYLDKTILSSPFLSYIAGSHKCRYIPNGL